MKTKNNDVFLNKINEKINEGLFDSYFTLPFMSRRLFLATVKERINKKINTGSSPILSDKELKDCLEDTKHIAVSIFAIYLDKGFIVRTEEGFSFTELGHRAIKASYRL